MSGQETLTLQLHEATREQLQRALQNSEERRRACDGHKLLHTWAERSDAIRAELARRVSR